MTTAIRIGVISSMGDPANFKKVKDDGIAEVDIVDGTLLIDSGQKKDKISFQAAFSESDWSIIEGYAKNRTPVTVSYDNRGFSMSNVIIRISSDWYEDGCDIHNAEITLAPNNILNVEGGLN